MNKLASAVPVVMAGMIVLLAAGPTVAQVAHAVIGATLTIGVVLVVLRVVWFYTR